MFTFNGIHGSHIYGNFFLLNTCILDESLFHSHTNKES